MLRVNAALVSHSSQMSAALCVDLNLWGNSLAAPLLLPGSKKKKDADTKRVVGAKKQQTVGHIYLNTTPAELQHRDAHRLSLNIVQ